MRKLTRRESLKALALAPVASLTWTSHDVAVARERMTAASRNGAAELQFFTEHEYETVKVLVDLILPRDERSGSATEAGVPEFMDFIVVDQPYRQTAMRGGLSWLDNYTRKLHGRTFLEADDAQRRTLLDEIAFPGNTNPEISQGIAFFNSFRDLTATGFWTSEMGIEDLKYLGNVYVPEWTGCPDEVLDRLGVADVPWPQSDAPSWTDTEEQPSPGAAHQH